MAQDLEFDPKCRQDHDVDGRMRVEPEHVLEKQRFAAQRRVEERHANHAVKYHHQQSERHYLGGREADDRRGEYRPDENRQPAPGHPRRAHGNDRRHEIQPAKDGRQSERQKGEQHEQLSVGVNHAQGRVGRPA